MENPPWTNEEMNHHNAFSVSGNLRTPSGSSLAHDNGTAVAWTANEDETLVQGLAKFSSPSEPIVSRYAKIAFQLQGKNVRDVAKRCQWMNKENAKRRKEDHNGLGRARVDNKEIINMVVASQPSHQQGITNELLNQNKQMLSQISENHTSLSIMDNLILFNKIRNNISTLVDNLKENVSETMKRMPSLRDKLNDELLDAIFLHLNLHE